MAQGKTQVTKTRKKPVQRKPKSGIFYDREQVIADWKGGNFTLTELGRKHHIATSTVAKVVKGIPKTIAELVTREVEIKQELMKLNVKEARIFHEEVDLRTRNLTLLYDSTHKNITKMMERFDSKKAVFSIDDHKAVQSTLKDARTTLLGNEPAVAIQQNNNVNQGGLRSMTPEEIKDELAKADAILGEYTRG
jgi:hypothetical protein